MKSIDKNKGLPATVGQQSPVNQKSLPINKIEIPINLSNHQMITKCIEETSKCIEKFLSYQIEKERTKQIEMECLTRVRESENRLMEVKIQEKTKQLKILSNHMKEIGELQNQREIIESCNRWIEQIISLMNELKLIYEESGDIKFIEMIHEQTLKLIELSKTIASRGIK